MTQNGKSLKCDKFIKLELNEIVISLLLDFFGLIVASFNIYLIFWVSPGTTFFSKNAWKQKIKILCEQFLISTIYEKVNVMISHFMAKKTQLSPRGWINSRSWWIFIPHMHLVTSGWARMNEISNVHKKFLNHTWWSYAVERMNWKLLSSYVSNVFQVIKYKRPAKIIKLFQNFRMKTLRRLLHSKHFCSVYLFSSLCGM